FPRPHQGMSRDSNDVTAFALLHGFPMLGPCKRNLVSRLSGMPGRTRPLLCRAGRLLYVWRMRRARSLHGPARLAAICALFVASASSGCTCNRQRMPITGMASSFTQPLVSSMLQAYADPFTHVQLATLGPEESARKKL